jgi:hypothetical protein
MEGKLSPDPLFSSEGVCPPASGGVGAGELCAFFGVGWGRGEGEQGGTVVVFLRGVRRISGRGNASMY